jgi:hypothetical protein
MSKPAQTYNGVNYNYCANEGATCTSDAPMNAIFGANGSFVQANMPASFQCTNNTFGRDPAPNVAKSCYAIPIAPVVAPPVVAPPVVAPPVVVPPHVVPPVVVAPIQASPIVVPPTMAEKAKAEAETKPSSSSMMWIIIAIIICLLCMCLSGAVWYFKFRKSGDIETN